jgi:hypothetical protein
MCILLYKIRRQSKPFLRCKNSCENDLKMREAVAKFVLSKRLVKGGKYYSSPRIYLPTKLTEDSSFPFKGDDIPVFIKIKGRKLIIQKASRQTLLKHGKLDENTAKVHQKTK